MKWRWLIFDYADPELPLSWRERLRLGWSTKHRVPRSKQKGLWAIGVGVPIAMVVYAMIMRPLSPWVQTLEPRWLIRIVVLLPIPILAWSVAALLWGIMGRKSNLHKIHAAGYNICLNCGYWLRNLPETTQQCPECGAAIEVKHDNPQ